jgi:hypothetical protein
VYQFVIGDKLVPPVVVEVEELDVEEDEEEVAFPVEEEDEVAFPVEEDDDVPDVEEEEVAFPLEEEEEALPCGPIV